MKIPFGDSAASTLGVEWELAIVDVASLEQVGEARRILDTVDDPENGPIRGEYLESMVELVSGVHDSVSGVTDELSELLGKVIAALEPHGLAVLAAGAHPSADPTAQQPVAKRNIGGCRNVTPGGVPRWRSMGCTSTSG